MPVRAKAVAVASVCIAALLPIGGHAEGIDTEHLFAFMIGSDVGNVGEREFQSQTTGRFSKASGTYRAIGQEFELEFVPLPNFRIELGGTFATHDIFGVPGFASRNQFEGQGVSLDLRYRFLDREKDPFGLTLAAESRADRIDGPGAREQQVALDQVSKAKVGSYADQPFYVLERRIEMSSDDFFVDRHEHGVRRHIDARTLCG